MATADDLSQLAATVAQLAQTIAERDVEQPWAPGPSVPNRLLLTVEEAADYLGIGRTLMYELIKKKEIDTVQIHRLRRVPKESVDAYAQRIVANQKAA